MNYTNISKWCQFILILIRVILQNFTAHNNFYWKNNNHISLILKASTKVEGLLC